MQTRRKPSVSVFEHFRSFWSEVEPLREAALLPAMAPPEGETTKALVQAPPSARERLLSVLRAQDAEVSRWAKGAVLDYYREAQYVMVAAADEVFVRLPWSGARYWEANLLETERFGTRSAGQSLFTRIERLLADGNPDKRELAAVYLAALALGFRGKYADRSDDGAVDQYRARLCEFIFQKSPDLAEPFRKLMPVCYESTVAAGTGTKLRSPRTWWWAAAVIVAAWLVVSQTLWTTITTPLRARIDAISQTDAQLGPGN